MAGGKHILALLIFGSLLVAGCSLIQGEQADNTPSPSPEETSPVVQPGHSPTPAPTAPAVANPDLPSGFPVDPNLKPMRVVETGGRKAIAPPAADGPTVLEVARDIHTRAQNDELSNRYGWNCRVHNRHEGAPAADWYLPAGTPVTATMRGQAELYLITTSNSFEYYDVDPGLTLGLPDANTPLFPLPGPGGGMGIFVSIINGNLRAEYGHLDYETTIENVARNAFIAPYSPTYDFESRFGRPIAHDQITLVASWPVQHGDVIGFVGNTGYSDVAHLHYQVLTRDRQTKFCPTTEQFPYNGWLFRPPNPLPP